MNDARLWVLNALADTRMAVSLLDPEEVDVHFRFTHDLDFDTLVELLYDMIKSGEIETSHCGETDAPHQVSDISELAQFVWSNKRDLCISITALGGALWEERTGANWDDYVSQVFEADNWFSVSAINHSLIENYLALEDVQWRIIPGTLSWDTVAPWQPMYWKTLEREAIRVRFKHPGRGMLRPKSAETWPEHPFRA